MPVGRNRSQGPARVNTSAEDPQRVSLQLNRGATEAEGIRVALSMRHPPVAQAEGTAAGEAVAEPAGWHIFMHPVWNKVVRSETKIP